MSSSFQKWVEKSFNLIIFFVLISSFVYSQPGSLLPELAMNQGLKNNFVRTVRQDDYGRTWIGTESGLKILNADDIALQRLVDSLKDEIVLSVAFLKNHVLIGTSASGLCIMDLKSGKIFRSLAMDTIRYVRKIRVLGDTAYVAANHAAGYVTIDQSAPKWHPFLWEHYPQVYIMDFYRFDHKIYGIDHSADYICRFYLKQRDSLLKTAYPESILPPPNYIYLTAEADDKGLKIAGDGFYSRLLPDKRKEFIKFKVTADSLKLAVWDMASVGNRQFLAMGQPYRMRMGAAYEIGSSSMDDIRKDFYCQSVFYDQKNDALWMGTANRGLFTWPHISTTHALPVSLPGKVRILPGGSGEKIIYNEEQVYRIFDSRRSPVLISSSNTKRNLEEIIEVRYWKDTIAVLRANSYAMYDLQGNKFFQLDLPSFHYSHFDDLNGQLAFFSLYDLGIGVMERKGGIMRKLEGMSIEARSIPYRGGLLYMCEEEGFYFLDTAVHRFSFSINKAQDFIIADDLLWVLNDGAVTRYKIALDSFALEKLDELSLDQMISDFPVNWLRRLQNGKILAGNTKGFVSLNPKTMLPEWYRYIGNFSELDNVVVNIDSLLIQQQKWVATIPGLQPYKKKELLNSKIDLSAFENLSAGDPLALHFNHPDFFILKHSLKQIDLRYPDGHTESYFVLDSIFKLQQALIEGPYEVTCFVNGEKIGEWNFRVALPLLRNPVFYTLLVLVLSGVLFVFFRYRSRQKDLERKMLENRMQLLKKNLDPHFIFNSLNLTYMLLMQGKYEEATQSILKFSDLHRYFLEMINQKEVSLSEEFSFLRNYIMLEQRRLDDASTFEFTLPERSELIHQIMIPPMILQPLVENAVKYCGYGSSTEEKRSVVIQCLVNNGKATVSIENTVSADALNFSNRLGKGVSIVHQIIDIYNKNSSSHIEFRTSVPPQIFPGGYRCELDFQLPIEQAE
jgi:hypothetical protein